MKVNATEAMPISDVEPNDNGSERMMLLVRMCTDDGLIGWSEAITMWPEACAAVKALIDGGLGTVVPGADPRWARSAVRPWRVALDRAAV
jgi:hypothetical protein